MIAFDRQGQGPPLLLLHGTTSSRTVWKPILAELTPTREVLAVDLPGHGDSAASSFTPPDWARDIAAFLDELGLGRVAAVGHSAGGWTALELAKLGRCTAVLALTPAGFWRQRSPLSTDIGLRLNWRIGQLLGPTIAKPLQTRIGRQFGLRQISAHPADVPAQLATDAALAVLQAKSFPEHFGRTRAQRFKDGDRIPPEVPVRIVWGAKDRIAQAGKSQHTDQLPRHAVIETWPDCGHMVMWDAPEKLVAAALALPAAA